MTFYLQDTSADLWEPYTGDKDVADYAKIPGLEVPRRIGSTPVLHCFSTWRPNLICSQLDMYNPESALAAIGVLI